MASINVFKIKFKNSTGELVESKNYYFNHNRKKVNTGISNMKRAVEYVENFQAEEEAKAIAEAEAKKRKLPDGNSLLEKLKEDGWLAYDGKKCLYEKNPKYILAQNTKKMTYGVQQAKMVGSVLRRTFEEKADELGQKPFNKITVTDVLAFRERLADFDFPNSTKNETMKALRAIYTFWMSREIVLFNPFRKTDTFNDFPLETKDEREIFSESELRTIFNRDLMERMYPNDKEWLKFLDSDYYRSFAFASLTGLRSGEVRCLQTEQIKNERILTVDRAFKQKNTKDIGLPKAEKVRIVVLCDSAYKLIEDRMWNKPKEYIFKNEKGNNAMEASRWNKKFLYFIEKIQKKYPTVFGGKYYTPHCLRKSLNTLLVNKYMVSPELVIDYMGWGEAMKEQGRSKTQKKHYTFTKAEHLIIVAQAIEKMYSGREMLWQLMDGETDNETDLELKKLNNLLMAGVLDE